MSELLSPLDGRYQSYTSKYANVLSESSYICSRTHIEMNYLIALLTELKIAQPENIPFNIGFEVHKYSKLPSDEIQKIVEIEKITKHDVKAIEYYLRDRLQSQGYPLYITNLIHFGLTSQDVNSLGFMIGFRQALDLIRDDLLHLVESLIDLINECQTIPILTKTHGQPAVPSQLDKELYVYLYRLFNEINQLRDRPLTVKFGGAIGNLNAHYLAFPDHDWLAFADQFVNNFHFQRSQFTKQIDNYESISHSVSDLSRIMVILDDLQNNLWLYVSQNYLIQKVVKGEVGSSTMPHKVNPINFENARGNIAIFIQLASVYSNSLPVSQYQRDLKDSTLLRSMGMLFGYGAVVIGQIREGIKRVSPNRLEIKRDLHNHSIVLMEAYQTLLRLDPTITDAYELAKEFSRLEGQYETLTLDIIHHEFIEKLPIQESLKTQMKAITVDNYLGQTPPMILLDLSYWDKFYEQS